MSVIKYLLFMQHPYALMAIGACLLIVVAGLCWLVLRIVQYRQWAADASSRELDVIASGLSHTRQGRLPLPLPSVGNRLDGLTPRTHSPRTPPGVPRPSSPPMTASGDVCASPRTRGAAPTPARSPSPSVT